MDFDSSINKNNSFLQKVIIIALLLICLGMGLLFYTISKVKQSQIDKNKTVNTVEDFSSKADSNSISQACRSISSLKKRYLGGIGQNISKSNIIANCFYLTKTRKGYTYKEDRILGVYSSKGKISLFKDKVQESLEIPKGEHLGTYLDSYFSSIKGLNLEHTTRELCKEDFPGKTKRVDFIEHAKYTTSSGLTYSCLVINEDGRGETLLRSRHIILK